MVQTAMGWRGTIRAIQAAERRAQREEQRRYRELQRQAKDMARLSALERARLEVETYENRLEVLLSVHKEQGPEWDWPALVNAPPPLEPVRENRNAAEVEARRAAYRPGFFDKLFGRMKKQEAEFAGQLQAAQTRDEREFQNAWAQYQHDHAEWQDERKLADAVLAGEHDAYVRVLRELTPFAELAELGSALNFRIHSPQLLEVLAKVNGQKAIPDEIKSLTGSGKVSCKGMPKSRFHEIYQDYVCGCVLRVAREAFALLPVETVIVTALTDLFDSRTGRTSEQPILSVALPRAVAKKLNFNRLDPSDAMENFLHRGDFKASRKSGAFVPITPLTPVDLETPQEQPAPPNPTAAVAVARPPSVNPFPAKWAQALRRNEIESGFLRLTANELAELLGQTAKDNFTLTESKALARATESFGYCLEPDPRHGAGSFWGNREIGIFQPPSGRVQEPSANFQGASALLQLCLLVAASDGTVDRGELDQFRRFIEGHFRFDPDEHQRLVVLETLLARNSASAKVTLGRTAKRVPPDKHIVIAQFLVDVAAADGVISPKEHKALARIFETLGLDSETWDTLIAKLPSAGQEVLIQAAAASVGGETIPAPEPSPASGSLKLDMARVAAISAETNEVIGLLAKAMTEEDDVRDAFAVPEITPMPTVARAALSPSPEPAETLVTPAKFEGLDAKFHPIVQRLMTRGAWGRADFDALAREHQLMPLSVFDAINEWADQQLGDFLLEGEEPIIIHRTLLNPEP
ncbi:MAG: tellurite resistance TerB C-terminal domain-containing protein [Verrucomicrobiota bacterium]